MESGVSESPLCGLGRWAPEDIDLLDIARSERVLSQAPTVADHEPRGRVAECLCWAVLETWGSRGAQTQFLESAKTECL